MSPLESALTQGNELLIQKRLDEAVACFQQVLVLCPQHIEASCKLVAVLSEQGRVDDAIDCNRRALAHNPQSVRLHDNLIFSLHFSPRSSAAAISDECCRFNQQHIAPLARLIEPHRNDSSPHRRLKIGYISPDFRAHVQALYMLPLLANHDPQAFEICCYADVVNPDFVTARLQQVAHSWRDIRANTDEQVAELIRRDRIDILVDLTMHMEGNRLLVFARKPAPVQVTWLAYPGTTGLTSIDYRLTDSYLDPPGMFESYYSEKTIRLPDSFWNYQPIALTHINLLPALANGHLTFGSLTNLCKVNLKVLEHWASVLQAVDGARLLMLAPEGISRRWVQDVFEQHGVSSQRIEFVARQARGEYLETYRRIDIALDTLPYNGHTTSLDALWMGVPVVTLVGQTVVGRAGLSQLTNLNLTELVAHTPDEFIHIASTLAHNLPRLSHLRSTLRPRMEQSPLMDAPRFARAIESAYRTMWHSWCTAQPS
jgi:protein O-GlcNAc transferase